ncbi:MAG: SDR family NAD(P)-dependent oxidoreductase [Bacilli bacterium]|nr:SDR family NAD(P)-dependent oxidoreductase [Bacilli bacterium]
MKKDIWTTNQIGDLTGKVFIVTGANSGIGFEATKVFAGKGAQVIMACRNQSKAQDAKQQILREFPDAKLVLMQLDLTDFSSIESFSNEVKLQYQRIDVLLNNAGIMTVPYGSTKDNLELQIGVNHFGHFYLTMKLLPLIDKTPNSRIVSIASIAHKFGKLNPTTFVYDENRKYHTARAYAQSKLANLLFTYGLQTRLEELGSKVKVLAAHPGISRTNLGEHIKTLSYKPIRGLINLFNQSQQEGSLPGIRACTDSSAKSGQYYGPSGFYEMKGHPVVTKSTKRSHSKELQNILWEESHKITKQDILL